MIFCSKNQDSADNYRKVHQFILGMSFKQCKLLENIDNGYYCNNMTVIETLHWKCICSVCNKLNFVFAL